MSPLGALAALALLAAGPAAADVVSAAPGAVAVTLYRDQSPDTVTPGDTDAGDTSGLALVVETRTVDLPAGRTRLKFQGVADGIIPESATVDGLPTAVRERNFDYDLLGPGSIIARSIGQSVGVVRTNPKTGKATEERAVLRSGPDGVVLDYGGRIEALGCSGVPERLVFDHAPPDLAEKPTLSAQVEAPAAGRYTVRLSYLTVRLNWRADYIARIRPDGRALDLTGWLTLSNRSSMSFVQAPTAVVAGNLERVAVDLPSVSTPRVNPECWPLGNSHHPLGERLYVGRLEATGGTMVSDLIVTAERREERIQDVALAISALARESQLGDYKLYTLAEPTTVAAHQTKQVMFLSQAGVKFDRVYAHTVDALYVTRDGELETDAATIVLRFTNTADHGLGRPLPAGAVSVRRPEVARGRHELLVGEYGLERDVPVGEPFELTLGVAPDVTLRQRVVDVHITRVGDVDHARQDLEIVVDNAMSTPAAVEIRHDRGDARNFTVTAESAPHGLKAGDPVWRLALAANAERTLRYTVEYDQ